MQPNSVREFQKVVLANSRAKGFWDPVNLGEKCALIHAEVSELLETYRGEATAPCPKDSRLTLEEEEMADIFIRLLELAEYRGIDLWGAAQIKHAYNVTREYKHGKNF